MSSYSTSVSGIIVLLNTKQLIDFVCIVVLNINPCNHRDSILYLTVAKAEFRGQFPYLDKLQDIVLIYTVSREPVRLPEIQYPVLGI